MSRNSDLPTSGELPEETVRAWADPVVVRVSGHRQKTAEELEAERKMPDPRASWDPPRPRVSGWRRKT